MPSPLPALNLIAPAGPAPCHARYWRARSNGAALPNPGIELLREHGAMRRARARAPRRIAFATAIAPIYAQTVDEFAHSAAYIHEVSGGRFRFGIGVAHGPSHVRMGVTPGKPLGDIRAFVAKFRSYDE